MTKKIRHAAIADPYEDLREAADELLQEIGYYMLRVTNILGKDLGPQRSGLDRTVARVARLIYRDDEAA